MKLKRILTMSIPALLLVGCTTPLQEPEVETPLGFKEKKVIITATFADPSSRVYYEEESGWLKQHWAYDDCIYGFDDDGNDVVLCVEYIEDDEGKEVAVLSPIEGYEFPSSGYIHMFYCGLHYPEDFSTPSCNVNFTESGNKYVDISSGHQYGMVDSEYSNTLGIMTADALVTQVVDEEADAITLTANLNFKNQTAIMEIRGICGLSTGAIIDRLEIEGVSSYGLIWVDDDHHTQFSFEKDNNVSVDFTPEWGIYQEPDPIMFPSANENGEILFGGEVDDEEGNSMPLYVAVFAPELGEQDHIMLKARLFQEVDPDNPNPQDYYYTYDLGTKTVKAGSYYIITPKEFTPPAGLPVARVGTQDYSSINEAFAAINESSDDDVEIMLLFNCTATDDLILSGDSHKSVFLDLNGHKLTLNENYLKVTGNVDLTIFSLDDPGNGRVVQSTAYPVLLVSNGNVILREGVTYIRTQGTSSYPLFDVTDNGSVYVSDGYYQWTSGPFSGENLTINGGYYSVKPVDPAQSVNPSINEDFVLAVIDNPVYPYWYIEDCLFNSLAYNSTNNKLATFTTDNGEKYYLARNNVFLNENGKWVFEVPNWEAPNTNQSGHQNLFTGSLMSDYDDDGFEVSFYDFEGVEVSFYLYKNLNEYQWGYILNSRYIEVEPNSYNSDICPRFLKCKVADGKKNLVVFPDGFTWPQTAGNNPGLYSENGYINQSNLDWNLAPTLSITQAEALLDVGCVFLPTTVVTTDDGDIEEGDYWTSSYNSSISMRTHFSFTGEVRIHHHPSDDASNLSETHSVRLAYPCK